ncbi:MULTISPECIES: immunoglobulin domain-containing protein [unclassified Carboxylicivirga]|uniref:immunoglobulin domain-containing protein n=1 Tax=Carboxylicivirga TaxID=1628153 RepID=UPI003D33133B
MKRMKHLFGVFVCLLLAVNVYGQEFGAGVNSADEQVKRNKLYKQVERQIAKSGASLKGLRDSISSLEDQYCSAGGADVIVPNSWHKDAIDITWRVYTTAGGVQTDHPEWFTINGSGQNTELHFLPHQVEPQYYGQSVVFSYVQTDGLGNVGTSYDYTRVYESPAVFNLGSDAEICQGQTYDLVLDGSEVGVEYKFYRDGTLVNEVPESGTGGAMSYRVSRAGVYTVKAIHTKGKCEVDMNGSATLIVNSLPPITATNGGNICLGLPFTLQGGPAGMESYTWTDENGDVVGALPELTLNSSAYGVGSHTFTLTVEDGKTCENSATTTVEVFGLPNVTAANNGPICEGGTATLEATVTGGEAPYSYEWTKVPDLTIVSTNKDYIINPVVASDAGTYEVSVSDANGCAATATSQTTLEVTERPTVSIAYNDPVCEGLALTLTATPSGGTTNYLEYVWYKNGLEIGRGAANTYTINPAVAPDDDGTYSVTVQDDGGCVSDAAQIAVTIHPNTQATASSNSPACVGQDIMLTGGPAGMDSYAWTGPDGFVSNEQSPVISNATAVMAGDYTLTIIDGNTCTTNATTTVVVNELPSITADNDSPVCEGQDVNLSSIVSGGMAPFTFSWSKVGNPAEISTQQSFTLSSVTMTDAGQYQVSVVDDNGCEAPVSAITEVTVNPVATVTVSNSGPVCAGSDITLSAEVTGGTGPYAYQWVKTTSGLTVSTDPSFTISGANSFDAGEYVLLVTDDNGCSPAGASTIVVVNSQPTVSISYNAPVCENTDLILTAVAAGGNGVYSEYVWYKDGVEIARGSEASHTVVGTTVADGGTYSVSVEDNIGCNSTTSDLAVTIHANPLVTADNNGPLCAGDNLQLTGGPESMDSYSWTGPNGFISTEQSPLLNNVTTAATGNYELTVTDNNTCSASATTIVEVNDINAALRISPAPPGSSVCENTELTFVADATLGSDDYTYEFIVNGTPRPASGNSIAVVITENTTVEVTITDNVTGCSDSDTQTINMVAAPKVSISAPNDGDNYCAGQPVTITADPYDADYQYEFFYNDGNGDVSLGAPSNNNTITVADGFAADVSIYVVTSIDFGCSSQSSKVNLTINPLPTPSITGNTDVCDGVVERYETEAGMLDYVWAYSGGQLVSGGNGNNFIEIRWNTIGTGSVTVTYKTNPEACAPTSPSTLPVVVSALPLITIEGRTEVCLNEAGEYRTQAGMTNYFWDVDGGTITAGQGSDVINVTWDTPGAGWIEVNYVNDNSCTLPAPARTAITVHNRPTPTISGDLSPCHNANEIYTTETGRSNYTWSVSGGTIIGADNQERVEVLWDTEGDYTISVNYAETAGSCSALVPTTENVTVNSLPLPSLAGPNEACATSGGHTYSTDAGMTNYVWTIVGGATAGRIDSGEGTNEITVTWLTPGEQIIEVTYLDANECSPAQPTAYVVTVNPLPVPTITGSPTVCEGSTMTYVTEEGMSNYDWKLGSGGTIVGASDTHVVEVQWDATGDHVLSVSYTDEKTCDAAVPSTATITVVDLPTPTIDGLDVACEGHTITYTTQSGAINYDWQITGGTIVSDPSLPTVEVEWSDPSAPVHEISVNYELFGCPAVAPFVLPVTVNAIPEVNVSGETSVCIGTQHVYTTEEGQNNYQWSATGGTILESAPYSNSVTVQWDVPGEATIEVNYDNSSGCSAVEATQLTVEVNQLPIPSITGDALACNTYSSSFSTEVGKTEYNWNVSGGDIISDDNNGTIEVEWKSAGTNTVSVSYKDEKQCLPSVPTAFTVEVLETPAPTITGGIEVCNNNFEVYETEAGHESYVWTVPAEGTIVSGDATEAITVRWNTPGTYTIGVNYQYANGCAALAATEMEVTVNPLAGVSLTASATNVIAGTAIEFTADGTDVVNYDYKVNGVEDASHDGSAIYTWTPNDITDDQTVIRVIAETSTGCLDSTELVISVFEGVIPTNVLPFNQSYCAGNPEAVSIYVSPDLIVGVTYELIRNEDGQVMGTVNYVDPTTEVSWTHGVDGVDFTYEGTATYRVEAYWPDVPGDRITMANPVTVTEFALPLEQKLEPTGTVNDCTDREIKLLDSQTGMSYELYIGGNPTGIVQEGADGVEVSFGTHNTIGEYTVMGYNTGNPLCAVPMSGSFMIDVAGVTPFNMTPLVEADRHYCAGEEGVQLGLDGSEAGVEYILQNETAELETKTGDGNAIMFDGFYKEGTYSVIVKVGGGCVFPMATSVVLKEDALPTAFTLLAEDKGHFCANDMDGVEIYLDSQEDDIDYQLFRGADAVGEPISGVTGNGSLSFGQFTEVGEYRVLATDQQSQCISETNVLTLVIDPMAEVRTLQGDTIFCEGGEAQLRIAAEAGVTYELLLDGLATADFGTAADPYIVWSVSAEGTYTVQANKSNDNTICGPLLMAGEVKVKMVPLPEDREVRFVEGDKKACAGDTILVINPQAEMRYALVSNINNEEVPGYSKQGTELNADGHVEFVINDDGGRYRVVAFNGKCDFILDNTDADNEIVVNNPNAVGKKELRAPNAICEGDGLVSIELLGAEADVNYILFRVREDADAGIDTLRGVAGDSFFKPLMNEGEYYVVGYRDAVYDPLNQCNNEMLNRITIKYNPLPTAYRLMAEPYGCGSAEAVLALENTQVDHNYYLFYHNPASGKEHIETIAGTGAKYEFGSVSKAGAYTVYAISDKGCSSSMKDTVSVSFTDAVTDFKVVGESPLTYCEAEGAYELMLEDQEEGVVYSVHSATDLISQVEGTAAGDALSLGQFTVGTYTITATRGTGCFVDMNGGETVTIEMQTSPQPFDLSVNDGNVCGNVGAIITLSGSEEGQTYILEADGIDQEDPKVGAADGAPIAWEVTEPVSGEVLYEVIAVSGGMCDVSMGMVEVNYKEMPAAPVLSPATDQEYCFGLPGISLSVANTVNNVGYQLINEANEVTAYLTGNGGEVSFPNPIKGTHTYYVKAIDFNSGCPSESAPIVVTEKPELVVYNVTLHYGNGESNYDCISSYCYGLIHADTIKLDMSQEGVDYILYNTGTTEPVSTVVGTGAEISFGVQSEGGDYYVVARSQGCDVTMNGSVRLAVEPLVAINDVFGLPNGEAIGEFNVTENDRYLSGVDYFPNEENDVDKYRNLQFEIISSWDYIDDKGEVRMFETIGDASINSEGKLEYKKLPNFFGRDSVRYRVINTEQPDRQDVATVFIFIGNVTVDDDQELLLPNAFSPNDDGINDTYVVSGTFVNENTVSKLEVFNRWGTVVYRSKGDGYGKGGQYWDGRANAGAMVSLGDKLPSGTYFYVFTIDVNIDGEQQTKQYSGFIELRR